MMNKADVCINHTIALSYGSDNDKDQQFFGKMNPRPGRNSLSFEKLLSYLDPPTEDDNPLENFFAANIKGHGTSIHSFIKDSKRYVWYNNPWGFTDDASHHKELPWPRYIDLQDTCAEDLKRRDLRVPIEDNFNYAELFAINAFRVFDYAEFMDNKGGYDLGDQMKAWDKRTVGYRHPMSVLYFLKLIFHADHLEVLHPSDTMPGEGPQPEGGEGLDIDVPFSGPCGACALWTSMYVAKVRDVIGSRVEDARVETLVHLVKSSLTKSPIHGKDDASIRSTMARGVDDREYSMKALMSLVYDVIPEKDFILSSHYATRKRKLSSVSTGWHAKVFHKLGMLVKLLEREQHKTTVQPPTRFRKVDPEYEDKIIAGYIETLAIVSGEDETNKGLTYLDKTGYIAGFVLQNRMGDLDFLRVFVDATGFLISCKHNDDPENADVPRLKYSERAPTRTARERHDRILRDTHADLFQYNLADRQRQIENSSSA